ncbi:MAG TPA: phospholipase D-like domain-containing protein, partial [Usitatibacter sp.]|nr:phospholipase D-like domain-containing protein [Usitatibacter sp.]
MRFKSDVAGGFQVFAVTGTNTISFAIQADPASRAGLLGFSVRRSKAGEPLRTLPGFKVFKSIIPKPNRDTRVSTWDHPVQSFVWDDFTAEPGVEYEYRFHPVSGTPKALKHGQPLAIKVRTEELFSGGEHDIFFNRGVASSQLYARRFGNKRPDKLPAAKQAQALEWLTRQLDEAIVKFIEQARKGDRLLCCFYEFRYEPVLAALKSAIDRGVRVEIIIDAKVNERTVKGKLQPSFPREENLAAIKAAGIRKTHIIERDANPTNIQHNKFMVLVRGKAPVEVWTGSTNLSLGGFSGQTNVGHWVRNKAVARAFKEYWDVLSEDPGSAKGDDLSVAKKRKNELRKAVEAIGDAPAALADIPSGVTPVFSPRTTLKVLHLYMEIADSAKRVACMTLAFGVGDKLKKRLLDNTGQSHVVFLLLEKKDAPRKNAKTPFVVINAQNNVYKAWGASLKDPLYQWVRETNARQLQLNKHVSYIHSKFLLMDPLGKDPVVATGSANFSDASTTGNDENMLLIRGDKRVADIYFTEFNRLFNHYYF